MGIYRKQNSQAEKFAREGIVVVEGSCPAVVCARRWVERVQAEGLSSSLRRSGCSSGQDGPGVGWSAGQESGELLALREMLVRGCILQPCGALVFERCRGDGILPQSASLGELSGPERPWTASQRS